MNEEENPKFFTGEIMVRLSVAHALANGWQQLCEKNPEKPTLMELYFAMAVMRQAFMDSTGFPPEQAMAIDLFLEAKREQVNAFAKAKAEAEKKGMGRN